MSLPLAYITASAGNNVRVWNWVEIEGYPWAYGNFACSSSAFMTDGIFSNRPYSGSLYGVKPWMIGAPVGFDQKVDFIEGTSTIASMQVEILDHSGTLTRDLGLAAGMTTGVLLLATGSKYTATIGMISGAYIQVTSASLSSSAIHASSSYPTSCSDYAPFYIGKEAFTYQARNGTQFNGIRRGMFNSLSIEHPAGALITSQPRSLNQKIAKIYTFISSSAPTTHALRGQVSSDAITRMVGTVTNCERNKDGTGYVLKIDSIDRKINGFQGASEDEDADRKRLIFSNRFRGTLIKGMPGATASGLRYGDSPDDEIDAFHGPPVGRLSDKYLAVNPKDASITPFMHYVSASLGTLAGWNFDQGRGYVFFVKVDDEILMVKWMSNDDFDANGWSTYSEADRRLKVLQRGCFGTSTGNQHDRGAEVVEVMPLVGRDNLSAGELLSTDSLYYLPTRFISGSSGHPINLALMLLTSTGKGTNFNNTNSAAVNYDKAPKDWSLGVDHRWLDIAEIEATRDQKIGALSCAGIIQEPFELKSFLQKDIYQVLGMFPVTKLSGSYSMRRVEPYTPFDDYVSISDSDILLPAKWSSNIKSTIGKASFKFDIGLDGKSLNEEQLIDTDAIELYNGVYGEINRSSQLLREASDETVDRQRKNNSAQLHFGDLATGGSTWLQNQIGWFQSFFLIASPVIDIRCKFKHHVLEPGDHVFFSDVSIPNVQTGGIGVVSASCIVIGKKIDDKNGVVDLTLIQSVYADNYKRIAPSAKVTAWNDTTKVMTIAANTDGFAKTGDADINWFKAGDVVGVALNDLSSISTAIAITSVDTALNTITFPSTPSITPVSGSHTLVFYQYDSAVARQTSNFAYLARNDGKLGATNTDGDTFIP